MLLKRQVIVVGSGRIGASLVAAIPTEWTITVIDMRQEALDELPPACRERGVRCVRGDATSRLVLEEAGLSPGSTLAIVTHNDRVNREVARIARAEFDVEEVVVLLDDVDDLESLGILRTEVVERSSATATLVLNRLSVSVTRGVPLGLGEGEILEVTLLDGSPAAGRTLRELKPRRWLVAAVYREDHLIVPHGETRLEAGDRVLLVGEPAVVESVGSFLRGGEAVFPTQFGAYLGLLPGTKVDAEAQWLAETTRAAGVVEVEQKQLDPRLLHDAEATARELVRWGVGCMVLEPRPIRLRARLGLARSVRKRFVLAARVPVLIARGTFPYKRILVAVGRDGQLNPLAGTAIDLARQCGAQLSVLTVVPPSLAEGEGAHDPMQELPRRVAQLARLHGVEVERVADEGNPIERIRHHAERFDLLVLGHSERTRNTLLTPDVSLFLLHEAPCSVMFVPWNVAGR